jgi:hypothetical protein
LALPSPELDLVYMYLRGICVWQHFDDSSMPAYMTRSSILVEDSVGIHVS